jgi:hypothetical protein
MRLLEWWRVEDMPLYHLCWTPFVNCKNRTRSYCERIVLPIPMPPTEFEAVPDWPPETWRSTLLCRSCGHVYEYSALDSHWDLVPIVGRHRFHVANCYHVSSPCSSPSCRVRLSMYVNMEVPETADDVRSLLTKPKFLQGFCPRQHKLYALPVGAYQIERTCGPLP